MALSIVALDRVIGYWSVIAVGLVLYGRRLRRSAAGGQTGALSVAYTEQGGGGDRRLG